MRLNFLSHLELLLYVFRNLHTFEVHFSYVTFDLILQCDIMYILPFKLIEVASKQKSDKLTWPEDHMFHKTSIRVTKQYYIDVIEK